MGVVVTVMNMKGGVGKTTVALHLAGMAATYRFHGKSPLKVLAIDYDPQFNMSQAFLPSKTYFTLEKERKTTISILLDDDEHLDPYHLQVPGNHTPPKVAEIATKIYARAEGRLDLVPSTLDLMYVALGKSDTQTKPIEERFEKFVDEARSIYDIIIIDCHPAGSLFTKTSLRNSDHVVIPVIPQRYAVRGIGLMMRFIAAKKMGSVGPVPHILFNATPRTGVTDEESEIRNDTQFAGHCMQNSLKWYKVFSEPEEGRGFVWFSKKPWSNMAFGNLQTVTGEFLVRTGAIKI